ncbi:hypothetical protein ACLD9W_00265 [Neisseria sp. WLZKY-1]|uniref:hypothetical protein n=1 Tax=Neisseria sp. WLZKY-1 TaxID=3390377 RepID=UPI0039793A9F
MAVLGALLLAACGGHEQYEGYWKRQGDGDKRPDVMQIVKEASKTYLLKENLLPNRKGEVHEKNLVLSQKDDGTLAVDTGFGSIPLVLSEDGKTLRAERRAYDKISVGDFDGIRQQVEQENAEYAKNEQLCEAMEKEYRAERDAHPQPQVGGGTEAWDRWREEDKALKEKFKAKRDAIDHCHFLIF